MAVVRGDRIGESQRLNACSPEAQDFYAAMIAAEVPDDFGRFRDTAHHVWIRMYPRREPTAAGLRRVRRLMDQLAAAGLWYSWSVDGVAFAELHNNAPRGNLYHRTPEPSEIFHANQKRHVHTKRCATTALARAKEWGDSAEEERILLLLSKKDTTEPEQAPSREGDEVGGGEGDGPRASVPSVLSVRSNGLTEPPTPKGADGAAAPARPAAKRARSRRQEFIEHPALARFVRAFNESFDRHVFGDATLNTALSKREADGHDADTLVALPILLAAQVAQGLDEIKGGRENLVPSWLLRDGSGRYGGQDGGTRNTKDWIGSILGRADQTSIAAERVPLIEELGLTAAMKRLGVKRKERKVAC